MPSGTADRPLAGIVVLDLSRMLPGAVLARLLLDLGARWIRVEEPTLGDPLRATPPIVDGAGAGFRFFLAGAESVALDVREPRAARAIRRIARHVDVLVESFRPGTMTRWGLAPERLVAINPALVVCSLSSYGQTGPDSAQVGHDLNFTAASGLLSLLPGDGVPRVQIADVGAALLASSAILAALLERARTGRGRIVDQSLLAGAAPFVAWATSDRAAGGGGLDESILSGRAPSYRLYRCADGGEISVAALEPKFWSSFVAMLGLDGLEGAALDVDETGRLAAARIAEALARHDSGYWLALARERGLPVGAVHDVGDDEVARTARCWFPGLAVPNDRPCPELGADTARVLAEFGADVAD